MISRLHCFAADLFAGGMIHASFLTQKLNLHGNNDKALTESGSTSFCSHKTRPSTEDFGQIGTGISLYRCLLYFPNLKHINLQLEQYLQAQIDVSKMDWGRLEITDENQEVLGTISHRSPRETLRLWSWVCDLVDDTTALDEKVEMRFSFQVELKDKNAGGECYRVAVFSSQDFQVRFEYMGKQMGIKQHLSEHQKRKSIVKVGQRSSFDQLPEYIRQSMQARQLVSNDKRRWMAYRDHN